MINRASPNQVSLENRQCLALCLQLPAKTDALLSPSSCVQREQKLRRPQGGLRERSQHQAGWGSHHQCGGGYQRPM